MRWETVPGDSKSVWELVDRQHGVVARRQLLDAGYSGRQIDRRLTNGRLHPLFAGVYAVGRPDVGVLGRWMAALLACPEGAVLSHSSAAALWNISQEGPRIEVSLPRRSRSNRRGILVHRPTSLDPSDLTRRHGIPVTKAARTLIDIAARLSSRQLEAAVNRADNLDLIDPERLADQVRHLRGSRGAAALRTVLDPATFRLTDSELERLFLRLLRKAKLPLPDTQVQLKAGRVDFHWADLGLVVEADSLRYHRTAGTQANDARRDRANAASGLVTLRFTHYEVRHEPGKVAAELAGIMTSLGAPAALGPPRTGRPSSRGGDPSLP